MRVIVGRSGGGMGRSIHGSARVYYCNRPKQMSLCSGWSWHGSIRYHQHSVDCPERAHLSTFAHLPIPNRMVPLSNTIPPHSQTASRSPRFTADIVLDEEEADGLSHNAVLIAVLLR